MSKLGAEILVNTQTLQDQTLSQTAKLNNGGFVTVWVDWASSIDTTIADGSWSGIKAQLFSATGAKVGSEILVNTATLLWQQDPHVAVLRDGNFVVTWTDGWDYFSWADHLGSQGVGGATADNYGKAVKLQVFSPSGTRIGAEIVATTEIRTDQTAQKITALGNGNFVVTWEDWSLSCVWAADGSLYSAGGGPGLKAQVFNSTGAKVGNELAVTGSYNYGPQITNLAGGGFVMTWHDGHYSVDDVRAQVFSDTGTKVGNEILVNTTGTGTTFSLQNEERIVALSNGGFAVAWTDNNGDDSYQGVKAQVFNSTGGKVGAEILVNSTTLNGQLHPQLAALKNGGFAVTWDNWSGTNPGTSGIDVNAQIFDNSGARVGSEILVNTSTAGTQGNAQITSLDNGGFAVSWFDSHGAWSGYSGVPKFQAFDALGNKVGLETSANTTPASGGASPMTALNNETLVVNWNAWDGSGSGVKAQIISVGKISAGGPGNDIITGGPGNNTIDGGSGLDTAVYAGVRSNFAITKTSAGFTVTDAISTEGVDALSNIERLQFADKKLALDLRPNEHGGQALEFIGLMAPNLVNTPSVVGLILGLFDQGSSLHDVCQLALDVGLVSSIAGSGSNAALAAMAFRNVIGFEADAATVNMLVGYMDGRYANYSQADFMTVIADMEVNQAHIGLIGLQQTGIEYV
jgi:hypothetical protein